MLSGAAPLTTNSRRPNGGVAKLISKTNNIRTLNLLKKPARGGIPPTENKRIAKDKEIIIFHFLRKDQLIKYLNKNPVPYITIGGGIGKMTKFAFGAVDLHSRRSTVDIKMLADICSKAGLPDVSSSKTALGALELAGNKLSDLIADLALTKLRALILDPYTKCSIVIVNRNGVILSEAKN